MDFILPLNQIPTIFSFKRMAVIYQPCLTQSVCHKHKLKASIIRCAESPSVEGGSGNHWNSYYLHIFIRNILITLIKINERVGIDKVILIKRNCCT